MAKKKNKNKDKSKKSNLRCPIVCVLGHVDHGKCLMPHEEVLTEFGSMKIEDIFNILGHDVVEKDNIKEIKDLNIKIYGVRSTGIAMVNASHAWRIKHKGKMIKIMLKNYSTITTTPEHPFLTNIGWLPAEELRRNLKIAIPDNNNGNIADVKWDKTIEIGKSLLGLSISEDIPLKGIKFVEIEKIESMYYDGYVYDLTTDTHNFISNGVVVHNTTLLDKIRKTRVAKREAGGITQHIGASEIPINVIKQLCGDLLKTLKADLKIPGLLVIDTPGHEAFTSLRKRGGSLADIAILVVDINEGFKPQTIEAVNILKQCKTPFVVAANKIDLIPGWNSKEMPFILNFNEKNQHPNALTEFEIRLYENIIKPLNELGFNADLYSRVQDVTKTVCIIPVSAVTGEGIPDLLMMVAGLAQRFLENRLKLNVEGYAKGTILEVKEEKGLGTTIDAIIYDGIAKRGDYLVVGLPDEILVTKIKALLKPKPLDEMRDPRDKFKPVNEVTAAAGVKIAAPDLDKVIAGCPIRIVPKEKIEEAKEEVIKEVEEAKIEVDDEGILIKADTLGSLEALANELRKAGIKIKKAEVGDVTKKDVVEAASYKQSNPLHGAIVAFNVKILPEAQKEVEKYDIKVFLDNILYKLVEDFTEWIKTEEERKKYEEFEKLIKPAIVRILPDCIFRQKDPAICGVEVISGTLKVGVPLIREDGMQLGYVREIKDRGENVKEAKAGKAVSISIDGRVILKRHVDEGDYMYVAVPENHVRELYHKYIDKLRSDEKEALLSYMELMQKITNNIFWGR